MAILLDLVKKKQCGRTWCRPILVRQPRGVTPKSLIFFSVQIIHFWGVYDEI